MNQKQIAKQIIAMNKTALDNSYNSIRTLYEQTEKVVGKFWELSPMFPEEGKKAISDWLTSYKNGCDKVKAMVDDKFKNIEDFFKETK